MRRTFLGVMAGAGLAAAGVRAQAPEARAAGAGRA